MSARPGQRRNGGWTAEQDAVIRDHPDWSSAQIAEAVSLIGETRTIGAASSRRRLLGIPTPPSGSSGEYAHYLATREIGVGKDVPWPSVPLSYQDQDRKHLRAILEAVRATA